MKQLSKMMLAAVASVALAAPAFAWDFSASGSSSATFKQTSVAYATGDGTSSMNTTSSAGGITVTSAHTDGDDSYSFSYTADFNSDAVNWDEYVTVTGSKKVGNWTASSSTSQYIQKDVTGDATPQLADGTAAITLTDGSMTYKLGDAAHLSTAEKAVNGPMDGQQDAEARVDSFQGFSVGMGVGPGTLTVALDMEAGAADTAFGDRTIAVSCGGGSTGFGLNFSGDVGADLSLTYATASSTASSRTCTGDNKTNAGSTNTMGLGVAIPAGPATVAIDFESTETSTTQQKITNKWANTGFEVSATMLMGDATLGLNYSTQTFTGTTDEAGATADDAWSKNGLELWYSVPVGAVTLDVGYGSATESDGANSTGTCHTGVNDFLKNAGCAADGKAYDTTTTQVGAKMSMSF